VDEAWDCPLPRVLVVVGDCWLWYGKEPKYGDMGEVGVLEGGCGAGLGLINLSGSSATSARHGLNGGVIAGIAESSGVVTACPKYDEPSSIPGKSSGVVAAEREKESQIPDSRLDRLRALGAAPS
jgi:hypothetical protein